MLKRRRGGEISLAGMGLDLAASVGVGLLLGWWIDRRFETGPWGVLICSSIGIIGGLLNFVRAAQAASRRAQPRNGLETKALDLPADRADSASGIEETDRDG